MESGDFFEDDPEQHQQQQGQYPDEDDSDGERYITLANGMRMPSLGFGTWNMPTSAVPAAVRAAVRSGYRLIDTSPVYGNQVEIGETLRELINNGEVRREDLFFVTKLWCNMMDPAEVEAVLELNLGLLRIETVDLMLMNWPLSLKQSEKTFYPLDHNGDLLLANYDFMKTWEAMEELVRKGKVRGIGVSNFNSQQLHRLIKESTLKPLVNQVECHPWLNQTQLLDFCDEYRVVLQAYAPLGSPNRPWIHPLDEELLINEKIVHCVAAKHKISASLVLLRFAIQRAIPVVTGSIRPPRIEDHTRVFDFKLDDQDMEALCTLDRGNSGRLFSFPEAQKHPEYPFHDVL